MNIAYVRVSTIEQNEQRQIEALEQYKIDKWFSEKISGKDTNRPKLQEMLEFIREGDTVFVHDFSRLARSTKDLLALVELFERKKVSLVSDKERIDSSTPTGKLLLTMIGALAEFERQNLLERQREGIEIAKRDGKYKGRREISLKNDKKLQKMFVALYEDYRIRKINKREFAEKLEVSRPTLNKLLNEYENK